MCDKEHLPVGNESAGLVKYSYKRKCFKQKCGTRSVINISLKQ